MKTPEQIIKALQASQKSIVSNKNMTNVAKQSFHNTKNPKGPNVRTSTSNDAKEEIQSLGYIFDPNFKFKTNKEGPLNNLDIEPSNQESPRMQAMERIRARATTFESLNDKPFKLAPQIVASIMDNAYLEAERAEQRYKAQLPNNKPKNNKQNGRSV